jgi:hypothetical protein
VILALTLATVAWMRWQQRPHGVWARLRHKVQRELVRLGVEAPMHESLAAWAERLQALRPDAAAQATAMLITLEQQRYSGQAITPDWPGLRTALRALAKH